MENGLLKGGASMLIHEKNQLSKAGSRTEKGAKSNLLAATFENVLRAFEDGDLAFPELQFTLKRLLSDGASPEELLKILRRRELIEPLPEYAQEEIEGVLDAEIRANAARSGNAPPAIANFDQTSAEQRVVSTVERTPSPESESDETAMSRLIQALAVDWDPEPGANRGASSAAAALDVENKAMRVALGQREEDLVALRSEHARVLGLLETRVRSVAQLEIELRELAAELESARSALQLQQNKTREIDAALARRIAAEEAARERSAEVATRNEEALRSAEIYRMELNALQESGATRDAALLQARRLLEERSAALDQTRHSLTERDAALDQARRSLTERDAQIASLQQERAQTAPMLESRAQSTAKLQADLQAAHARGAALEADLAAARAALSGEQSAARQIESALAEKSALSDKASSLQRSLDERSAELAAYKQEQSKITAALAARAKSLESELKGARQRIETLNSEAKKSRDSASSRVVVEPPQPAPSPQQAKPIVEVAEFAPPSGTRRWTSATSLRVMGACAVVAALVIGAWMFAHRVPAAKVPEVAAAPAPQPGSVIRDCPMCPALTVLPTGRFKQGSAESSSTSFVKPLHWVVI